MAGKNAKNRRGTFLMGAGLLLVAAALFLTVYNLWDERRATETAAQTMEEMAPLVAEAVMPEESGEEVIPDYLLDPGMDRPTVEIGGRDYIGTLEIPALELSLPVISRWSYPNLKIAPCRYAGDTYEDHLIIAGHNYQSHFGRLKELLPGDLVQFTDVDGNVFSYSVVETEILKKTDVEELESGDWDLTLFTCTIGGKTRVTVRCKGCVR
nr:sortase [uncultured Oscillibacter sp.]